MQARNPTMALRPRLFRMADTAFRRNVTGRHRSVVRRMLEWATPENSAASQKRRKKFHRLGCDDPKWRRGNRARLS